MMENYMSKLRDLREDNDLTQQQVADYLGTSQTMYARYERGASELPLRHLVKLCQLYNVSADKMLNIIHDVNRATGKSCIETMRFKRM